MTRPTTGSLALDECFDKFANNRCLIRPDGSALSYREVAEVAERQAKRLLELGVAHGQRVGLSLPHGEEHLTLYLACAMGGYVACPLDASLPEPRAARLREALGVTFICSAANKSEWSSAPKASTTLPPAKADSDFLIIASSGTTKAPKGIIHTLRSMVESAKSFAALAEHDASTVVYHHFPMHYMAGVFNMWFCPLVSGAAVALGERFEQNTMYRFWDLPRKLGVNHLTLTPTIAASLAQLFRRDDSLLDHLKTFRSIVSTSSTLHESIARRFYDTFGVPLRGCYGVTEVGGSVTLQTWEQAIAFESTGVFGSDVAIRAGTEAQPGPVLVKTPFMMRGYVNQAATAHLDADGYFDTGDLGYVRNGALFITGRTHDLVKKGGEFIALSLIEDVAMRPEGVVSAAAVAVPDEFWGNKIVLFFVAKPESDFDAVQKAIDVELKASLRKIEVPDKTIQVPRMPTTSIGKTLKSDLIALYTI